MPKPRHKFLKAENSIRIIGGVYGGRKLKYQGDPGTRPMKDRTREAVFNLIGTELEGKHVVDLFGGTGAMAIEAISRGAQSATVIERHFPMAKTMRENIAMLDIHDRIDLVTGDVFAWGKRGPELPQLPRVLFCCPPYALYEERLTELLELLSSQMEGAKNSSVFVMEFDERFSTKSLPDPDDWDVRPYAPAVIAVRRV